MTMANEHKIIIVILANLSARFLQLALSIFPRKFGKFFTIPMASNNGGSFLETQPINVLLFLQLGRTLQYNITSTICQGLSQ